MSKRTWFSMQKAAADDTVGEIVIYDLIGFWGVDSVQFYDALQALGPVKTLNVRINSPGGDVYQGVAIHNMLARHAAHKVVTVDGIAASIASLVMMAGDERLMPENSAVLIHNPMGGVQGTADDMLKMGEWLNKIRDGMVTTYATATKQKPKAIETMLAAETWLTPADALAKGFATKVLPPADITAKFDLRALFQDPPRALTKIEAKAPQWSAMTMPQQPLAALVRDSWDAKVAAEAILADAGFNGEQPDPAKARAGFLVYDLANPDLKASYKLPIAELVDGKLTVVSAALTAAAAELLTLTGPGPDQLAAAKATVEAYQATLPAPSPATPADPAKLRAEGADQARNLALEIASACALAGKPEKTAEFLKSGKPLAQVMSELQAMRADTSRRGNPSPEGGRTEPDPHHSPARGDTSWDKIVAKQNANRQRPGASA